MTGSKKRFVSSGAQPMCLLQNTIICSTSGALKNKGKRATVHIVKRKSKMYRHYINLPPHEKRSFDLSTTGST